MSTKRIILTARRETPSWVLAILVLLAPLTHGSVDPVSRTVIWVTLFGLLALELAEERGARRMGRAVAPAAALGGLALLALAQSLPWPAAIAGLLSSEHRELAVAAAAARGDEVGASWVALSLSPGASRGAALTLAAMAAAWLVAATEGRHRYRRRRFAAALMGVGLLQLLFGAIAIARTGTSRTGGTFVNPDHAAVCLEIALAVAFAWIWASFRRTRREPLLERRLLRMTPSIVVWSLLVVALLLTGSRAGLAAAAAGTVAQAVLLFWVTRRWRVLIAGLSAAAAGAALVGFLGIRLGFERVLATPLAALQFSERLAAWGHSLKLFPLFPLTGTGLGTFLEAFPLVQPEEMAGLRWVRAHNDYLELLVTGGLVGIAIAGYGVCRTAAALFERLRRSVRSENRAFILAACGAAVAVGVHELVDFGLTLPSNALALTVLLGAAQAEVPRRAGRTSGSEGPRRGGGARRGRDLEQVESGGGFEVDP